jgi:hypothetical protein
MVSLRPSNKRSLNIADEDVGDAAEVEEAIPVGIVAGKA